MARCPFAVFDPISGPVGPYTGGPFKIVHHTTEGSTYAGAKAAYTANQSDPHFTVSGEDVFQHIDTGLSARALKNESGGVETNRDSAVQIEVVGFAGQPKDVTTLKTVAKLCRWIEAEHAVPQQWPNGKPRSSTNGSDPGGHNRDAATWDGVSGHYGHSQVPENVHWDPGYTSAELALVTPDAVFDLHDTLALDAARARVEADVSQTATPASVVQRILSTLDTLAASPMVRQRSRIAIRVSTPDLTIEVVLEGGTAAAIASADTVSDVAADVAAFVPLPQSGPGYYTFELAANQFGTQTTIDAVLSVAQQWQGAGKPPFGVGDISLAQGGPMPGHTTGHQLGKNVDVRPMRTDGQRQPVTFHDAAYSRADTQALVDAFRAHPNFRKMFFNDPNITGVERLAGHDNHLHVEMTS